MRVWMLGLALLAGCFDVEPFFRCARQDQCVSQGTGGFCEDSGYCSFPDSTCVGGARRYGSAPDPFGDQCVGEAADLSALSDLPAPADGGALDAAVDLSVTTGVCPYPQLLITVEDLEVAPATPIGELRRFSIPASGPLQACNPLNGSGLLAPLPQAVALISMDRLAVAGSDKITVLEPSTDTVRFTWDTGAQLVPIDVAPLDNAGDPQLAVGLRQAAAFPPYLYSLILYKEGTAAPVRSWLASALGLPAVLGFAADPWNAARLMMLDEPRALEFVDPLAPAVTPYFGEPGGIGFHSLGALRNGPGARVIWTARNTYNGFYTGNDANGPSVDAGPYLVGPTQCSGCDMLHAVPDPTDGKRAFVLCDTGGALNSRIVYRATWAGIGIVNGSCQPVFDGSQLRAKQRLTHLALAL